MIEAPKISRKEKEEAVKLGGIDLSDFEIRRDEVSSCEKPGHRDRSIANDERHRRHFRDVVKFP